MTQEELDSLIMQGVGGISSDTTGEVEDIGGLHADAGYEDVPGRHGDVKGDDPTCVASDLPPDDDVLLVPPSATEKNRVVNQLDDVTRDSELKMTQIFDQIEHISNVSGEIEGVAGKLRGYLKSQENMLSILAENFPNIRTFAVHLEQTRLACGLVDNIQNAGADCTDAAMNVMDILQYQDIHRQKIERVINVMRALSQYMTSLFGGKIDDSKRVGSASYITGDSDSSVASDKEIEELIVSFGRK